MIIAAPADVCLNQQMNMVKRISESKASSSLVKRDGTLIPKEKKKRVTGPFNSVAACETATKNCSGRGTCVKTGYGFNGTANVPVYGCACDAIPIITDGKVNTLRFAGVSCQKKDVSVEFNMFLWTGIAIFCLLLLLLNFYFLLVMNLFQVFLTLVEAQLPTKIMTFWVKEGGIRFEIDKFEISERLSWDERFSNRFEN